MNRIDPTGLEWRYDGGELRWFDDDDGTPDDDKDYQDLSTSDTSTPSTDEMKKRARLREIASEINELLANPEENNWYRWRLGYLDGELRDGLGEYTDSDYNDGWLRDHTGITITTGVYGERGVDKADGILSVDFMGVSLGHMRVQTWPDSSNGGLELPHGEYLGVLYDHTYSYNEPIRITGPGLPANEYYLIHPNYFTREDRIRDRIEDGQGWGPFYYSSEGCQMTGYADFNRLTRGLKSLGFQYKDRYSKRDTIKITIKGNEG